MAPEITVKTSGNYEDAMMVRTKVFIAELHYNNEADDKDAVSKFVTVYVNGVLAGTGRMYAKDDDSFVFGRIAVLPAYRGCRLGAAIIASLQALAMEQGGKRAFVRACEKAIPFYEACGFSACDCRPVFEEGRKTVWMEKSI